MSRGPTFIWLAVSTLIALAAALPAPALAQEDLTAEQYDALSHALGMSIEDIRALGLSPEALQVLVDGFTEETVVVGSRGQPRTVATSPVPVDVLSIADLTNQGVVNLQDQLRTVIPSFNVNTQPISDASTVVRPAMLRNLAPDHTLVLVNGTRRHRSSVIDWHGGNGVAYGSQGPDLSAIPAIALRQVEVLRDGAAAQYGSDAIAGVMNFQLKDAASGGRVEFATGTFQEGDGEAFTVAGNVGLPLGATGFANLSLEYGRSNPTNRSAPRSDAIALLAAGNTHVASDTPQIWGSAEVDDDVKLFGHFGYTFATGVQLYGHTNYASKRVTGGFFFRNPTTRGGVFSPDGGGTLLVGDQRWAETGIPGAGHCPTVPIVDNVPDGGAFAAVTAHPNCFTLYERFPGGFTPNFGGEAQDRSVVGGVRGVTDAGFNWDASVSVGAHETDLFIRDTVNASLGYDTPTAFDLGSNRQQEVGVNVDVSYTATDMVTMAGRRGVARRAVSDRRGRAGVVDGRPVRARPGFLGRLERLLRLRSARRRHLEPQQHRGVRRPRRQRRRGRLDRRRRAAGRALRGRRPDDQRQGLRARRLRTRQREQRFPRADPRPAERLQYFDGLRPGHRRPGQQRCHPVDLAGGGAARRRAAQARALSQLHGGRRFRHRAAQRQCRLLPHRCLRPHRYHEQLRAAGRRDRQSAGARDRQRPRPQELPVFHQCVRHGVAGNRRGFDLHADCLARQYRVQRGVQLHRHRSDRQRQGTAERPAAGRVRLCAAARALECRDQPASGTGAAPRPRELLRRLVRLGQRIQSGLPTRGRHRAGVLCGATDRRCGREP